MAQHQDCTSRLLAVILVEMLLAWSVCPGHDIIGRWWPHNPWGHTCANAELPEQYCKAEKLPPGTLQFLQAC